MIYEPESLRYTLSKEIKLLLGKETLTPDQEERLRSYQRLENALKIQEKRTDIRHVWVLVEWIVWFLGLPPIFS